MPEEGRPSRFLWAVLTRAALTFDASYPTMTPLEAALRREYGRENEPFDILLALLEPPTPDLYKRAEEIGISAVMSAPWMGVDLPPGDVERFREPIEALRRNDIAKVRG